MIDKHSGALLKAGIVAAIFVAIQAIFPQESHLSVPVAQAASSETSDTCRSEIADSNIATISCNIDGGQWFHIRVDSTYGSPQTVIWVLTCGTARIKSRPVVQNHKGVTTIHAGLKAEQRSAKLAAGRLLRFTKQPCVLDVNVESVPGFNDGALTTVAWGVTATKTDSIDVRTF